MTRIRLAVIALLGVCFTWGAAFVLMKDAIEKQPYMDFLALRFSLAAVAMFVLRPKVSSRFEKGDIKIGLALGVILAFGYITQTIGLELTTAATSSSSYAGHCVQCAMLRSNMYPEHVKNASLCFTTRTAGKGG